MYSMSTIKIFAAGCLALLILSGSASASLGVISLEELTCKAELIVHGSVASVEHVVAERETSMGKLSISTAVVHIDPDRILKGAASKPIVVKAVENMEDSPRFRQGQEIFLFLIRNEEDSSFSVFGLTQGKFDVKDGAVIREQVPVAQFTEKVEERIRIQDTD